MSKGRRRIQAKKADKLKEQDIAATKRCQKKGRQSNFAKVCLKVHENTKENKNCNRKRITSNRITVPLGFFNEGIKSKVVRKGGTNVYNLNQESCNFINEDLHALLQNAPDIECNKNLQCRAESESSERMVTRSQSSKKDYKTASDYYMKLHSEYKSVDIPENIQKSQTQPQQNIERNKSMFKEIDKCYSKKLAEIENYNKITNINYDEHCKDKSGNAEHFCKNLEEQLSTVTLKSRKIQCLSKIKDTILEINNALEGKETSHSSKITPPKMTRENVSNWMEHLIPITDWSYETPNNKILKRPTINSFSNNIESPFLYKNKGDEFLFQKFSKAGKFFKSKAIPSANGNHTSENFKYPEQTAFKISGNSNEFPCSNGSRFLFNNSGDIFKDKPFNIHNSFFIPNYDYSREPLHDIVNTPKYFNIEEPKRPRLYNGTKLSPINFFDNLNIALPTSNFLKNRNGLFCPGNNENCPPEYLKENLHQMDVLNNYPRCSKFHDEQNFDNDELFLSTKAFYGKKPLF